MRVLLLLVLLALSLPLTVTSTGREPKAWDPARVDFGCDCE